MLLNLPRANYEILPLVMILASVALFVRLARSSELVVVRARAGRRCTPAAPLASCALIGCRDHDAQPDRRRHVEALQRSAQRRMPVSAKRLAIAAEGLWLRQGDADGQTVIHAERASSDLDGAVRHDLHAFDPDGPAAARIDATAARLTDGRMAPARRQDLGSRRGATPRPAPRDETDTPALDADQDRIIDSFGKPEYIPLWELPAFIAQLEQAGILGAALRGLVPDGTRPPLFLMALVMVAAAFTMRHARLANTGHFGADRHDAGLRPALTSAISRRILGENGRSPCYLAAWAPPVASSMLAIGILLHMEDG